MPALHRHSGGYEDEDPDTTREESTGGEERHLPCHRKETGNCPKGEPKCKESYDNLDCSCGDTPEGPCEKGEGTEGEEKEGPLAKALYLVGDDRTTEYGSSRGVTV